MPSDAAVDAATRQRTDTLRYAGTYPCCCGTLCAAAHAVRQNTDKKRNPMLKQFKEFTLKGNMVDQEVLLTEIRDLLKARPTT